MEPVTKNFQVTLNAEELKKEILLKEHKQKPTKIKVWVGKIHLKSKIYLELIYKITTSKNKEIYGLTTDSYFTSSKGKEYYQILKVVKPNQITQLLTSSNSSHRNLAKDYLEDKVTVLIDEDLGKFDFFTSLKEFAEALDKEIKDGEISSNYPKIIFKNKYLTYYFNVNLKQSPREKLIKQSKNKISDFQSEIFDGKFPEEFFQSFTFQAYYNNRRLYPISIRNNLRVKFKDSHLREQLDCIKQNIHKINQLLETAALLEINFLSDEVKYFDKDQKRVSADLVGLVNHLGKILNRFLAKS